MSTYTQNTVAVRILFTLHLDGFLSFNNNCDQNKQFHITRNSFYTSLNRTKNIYKQSITHISATGLLPEIKLKDTIIENKKTTINKYFKSNNK